MVRTAGTVIKSIGGKSSKTKGVRGISKSNRHTSRKSIGGNKLIQRPTPMWQKAIDGFIKNKGIETTDEDSQNEFTPTETPKISVISSVRVQCPVLAKTKEPLSPVDYGTTFACRPFGEGTSKEVDSPRREISEPKWARAPGAPLNPRYMPNFALLEQFEKDNCMPSQCSRRVYFKSK